MRYRVLIVLVILVIASACGADSPTMNAPANATPANAIAPQPPSSSGNLNSSPDSNSAATKAKKGGHEHTAPHGGTLIVFGKEFAHLEIVVDASSGHTTAYALDGEAERSVKIAQKHLIIEVEKPAKFSIRLDAVENSLTGEKRGATSEFGGKSEQLKNLREFDGRVTSITIRGRKFDNVNFNFPAGNEGGHSH